MRKRTKRKHWALVDTIKYAAEGAAITPRHLLDKLLMRELSSLDAFARGAASIQEWHDMAALVNNAQTLAECMGIGKEALPDILKAEAGLVESAARFQKIKKFGLSGPSITALKEVVEWHDLQRASIPRSQYDESIRITTAHVQNGHRTIDLDEILGHPVAL